MHIVLRPAFVLQAVLGTLAARCFATSGISSYRLVVDLPSTFERAELVLIEGQDPLIAIRNFARAHPLGLEEVHQAGQAPAGAKLEEQYPRRTKDRPGCAPWDLRATVFATTPGAGAGLTTVTTQPAEAIKELWE